MRGVLRVRQIAKWIGVSVCAVIVTGSCLTECKEVLVKLPGAGVASLGSGYTGYYWENLSTSLTSSVRLRDAHPFSWMRQSPVVGRWSFGVGIANWLLVLLILIPTALLFWRDRKIPAGHCTTCGYNLTGNISGVCSECGAKVTARDAQDEIANTESRNSEGVPQCTDGDTRQ